jgi:hypothetical protein
MPGLDGKPAFVRLENFPCFVDLAREEKPKKNNRRCQQPACAAFPLGFPSTTPRKQNR